MYFYIEIGNNEEVRGTLNLPKRPNPKDIKIIDGKPALRPLVIEDVPVSDMAELYETKELPLIVEPTRVVKKFKATLKSNYKALMADMVASQAHLARTKILNTVELIGTGLLVKMMMDEEAEEFLNAPDEDRTAERFPLVHSGVGFIAPTAENVAKQYRANFVELKRQIANIEAEKLKLLKVIDEAKTPDAAIRAYDKRSPLLKET